MRTRYYSGGRRTAVAASRKDTHLTRRSVRHINVPLRVYRNATGRGKAGVADYRDTGSHCRIATSRIDADRADVAATVCCSATFDDVNVSTRIGRNASGVVDPGP